MYKSLNVEAIWTGSYPALCCGEWIIKVNGKEIEIPEDRKKSPMYTKKTYRQLVDVLNEEFKSFKGGLNEADWINKNRGWLMESINKVVLVNPDEESQLLSDLFNEINKEDWRYNSCGGCI